MAELEQRPTIALEVTFTLTEAEARALDAIVGYGHDAFLKVFYEHLGTAYLQPHVAGLTSLFESVREKMPPILNRLRDARGVFNGTHDARKREQP